MRSVIVKEPGQLNIASRPVPVPGSHEVRVKIAFAGICGSDVHIYQGHNPFAKYPRVIGHEFFGIVDAVGEQVSPARIGERVAVDPVVSCGHCYPCSVGRPNVCAQLQVIGVPPRWGIQRLCLRAGQKCLAHSGGYQRSSGDNG